jgi:hypothetical protein
MVFRRIEIFSESKRMAHSAELCARRQKRERREKRERMRDQTSEVRKQRITSLTVHRLPLTISLIFQFSNQLSDYSGLQPIFSDNNLELTDIGVTH